MTFYSVESGPMTDLSVGV